VTLNHSIADDSEPHFVDLLALHMWPGPDGPRCSSRVRPSMWVPGTQRPRVGVFATMVDMVGGLLPDGFVTPTIDLRLSVVDDLPSEGRVELATTTLKFGRRFLVSDTLLRSDGRLFARGSTTFLSDVNLDLSLYRDNPEPEIDVESFDALLSPTVIDGTTLELVPRPGLSNGMQGTVQGGVQATFAEIVAEHALGGSAQITDIDIRYLQRLKVGPLHGAAEILGTAHGVTSLRILLTDAGFDDRVVSYAAVSAVAH